MVVAKFAGFGGEAEICDRGDGDVCFRARKRKAVCPGVFGLVLEV